MSDLSRVINVPADNTTGPLRHFKKSADDELRYCFHWADWLKGCDASSITSSAWDVPAGLTDSDDEVEETKTHIYIDGGTAGETYTIANTITTENGQTVKATLQLTIVEEE